MTTYFIGTTFGTNSQWHTNEVLAIDHLKAQINKKFPTAENLIINTTWFGPQFDNGQYKKLNKFEHIDNLFFITLVDEIMLTHDQIENIRKKFNASLFLIGNYDSPYEVSFISTVIPDYFKDYNDADLLIKDIKYLYLCYNRKPREHRVKLVKQLIDYDLVRHGLVTLGKNDKLYSKVEYAPSFLLGEQPDDFANEGNWGMAMSYGIPHDIHSLGNMDIWQNHFLNIISETTFNPWDHTFVTEKTWKPIIGLRPFIINGSSKLYLWLRNRGFRTFEKYFNNILIEDIPEYEVHNSIMKVVQHLASLDKHKLMNMYNDMLPDLMYNRTRFLEFSKEQKIKLTNLFT